MRNINFKKVLLVLGVGFGMAASQAYAIDYETCYILKDACFNDGIARACELYFKLC
ncbi:MAG: hypothetical protein ACI8WB_005857 [Phenylobacterium sp.]|jgi:hypothetical protein